MYKGVICFKVSHTTMGNLQYRSHVWICQQLCQDSVIPQNICLPVPLFYMYDEPTSVLGSLCDLHDLVGPTVSFPRLYRVSLFKDSLSRLDVFISILSRAISIVSCRKNNQQPMSIPQNQDR